MGVILQESQSLAELIPEIHCYVDADTPLTSDLTEQLSRYIGKLVLKAFFGLHGETIEFDPEWLRRLRNDPALIQLSVVTWVEVYVVDTDGTFIITTKESEHVE
jgi:hypothetical protein